MCEKCLEIDEKIKRYRRVVDAAADELTRNRMEDLIQHLKDEKRALHPDESRPGGDEQPFYESSNGDFGA
jgi:hypothetical protein